MAAPILPCAPTSVTAGDTWQWRQRAPETTPADGWTLKVVIAGAKVASVTADVVAGDFVVAFGPATTAPLPAGTYRWSAFATSADATERLTIDQGVLAVEANPETITDGAAQSHEERALALVEAQLEQLYADPIEEYTHDTRAARTRKIEELERTRANLKAALWRKRNGGRLGTRVAGTFRRPA